MNNLQDSFFNAPLEEITQFLIHHYSEQEEAKIIARLASHGATIVEIPDDYEPRRDALGANANWLERADFLVSYHGTSSTFEQAIQKKGLLPSSSTGVNNFTDSHPHSVYLGQLTYFQSIFGSVKNHAFSAADRWGGVPLLVRTIVPVASLLPDDDWEEETGPLSYICGGSARIEGGCDIVFPYREDPRADVDFYYGTRTAGITFNDFREFPLIK